MKKIPMKLKIQPEMSNVTIDLLLTIIKIKYLCVYPCIKLTFIISYFR